MKRFIAGWLLSGILLTMISQSCWAIQSPACCQKASCHCDSNNGNFKSHNPDSNPLIPWAYSTQKPITLKSYEIALLPGQNLFHLFFNSSVSLAFRSKPWLVPPNESPQARLHIWLI